MKTARDAASRILVLMAVMLGLLAAFIGMVGVAIATDDLESEDK